MFLGMPQARDVATGSACRADCAAVRAFEFTGIATRDVGVPVADDDDCAGEESARVGRDDAPVCATVV